VLQKPVDKRFWELLSELRTDSFVHHVYIGIFSVIEGDWRTQYFAPEEKPKRNWSHYAVPLDTVSTRDRLRFTRMDGSKIEIPYILDVWWKYSAETTKSPSVSVAESLSFEIYVRHWFLTLIFAILPAIWLYKWRKRRKLGPTACPDCGYDLRGNETGECPECGKSTGTETAQT